MLLFQHPDRKLLGLVIIAALSQLGINTTSLVALLGAAGLAIGLSLQSSLSNFASGVMLIIFRPFTKGDFVEAEGMAKANWCIPMAGYLMVILKMTSTKMGINRGVKGDLAV